MVIRTFPVPEGEDLFAQVLQQRQLEMVDAPMIEVVALLFQLPEAPAHYDWLVFTSKNGIKSWFTRYTKAAHQKIAVLGPSSNEALKAYGQSADFTGSGHSGSVFAEEFQAVWQGQGSLLLVLGKLAPDVVQETLSRGTNQPFDSDIHR